MSHSILVPLDGSTLAERALPHAAMLARLYGASVLLLRVPESIIVPVLSAGIWITEEVEPQEAHLRAEQYLAETAGLPLWGDLMVETMTPPHPVAQGLLRAIEATEPLLTVMTTHGRSGAGRVVLGSIAEKIVHTAPGPVYLIRVRESEGPAPEAEADSSAAAAIEAPIPPLSRLLVPLDGSPLAETVLPVAVDLARRANAALTLIRVPTVPGYATAIPETAGWIPQLLGEQAAEATAYLEGVAARLEDGGIQVSTDVELVTAGSVAEGILASAAEHRADLVMMASHGRTGLARWFLGSVADSVIHHATLPVWLIRGQAED